MMVHLKAACLIHWLGRPPATAETWAGPSPPATAGSRAQGCTESTADLAPELGLGGTGAGC